MRAQSIRRMFVTAALFNWLAGGALSVNAAFLFGLFHITPVPAEPLFLQMFAWVVIVFGVGYYWASRDPAANAPVIRLGALAKLSVFAASLVCVLTGSVSWQVMLLTSVDLLYAALFYAALRAGERAPAGF